MKLPLTTKYSYCMKSSSVTEFNKDEKRYFLLKLYNRSYKCYEYYVYTPIELERQEQFTILTHDKIQGLLNQCNDSNCKFLKKEYFKDSKYIPKSYRNKTN